MDTYTITPELASEPGALDGFRVTCSCGSTWTTSLSENEARFQANAHLAWHEQRES